MPEKLKNMPVVKPKIDFVIKMAEVEDLGYQALESIHGKDAKIRGVGLGWMIRWDTGNEGYTWRHIKMISMGAGCLKDMDKAKRLMLHEVTHTIERECPNEYCRREKCNDNHCPSFFAAFEKLLNQFMDTGLCDYDRGYPQCREYLAQKKS